MKEEQQKILATAKGEIGKQEIPAGSNWGPDVQGYLAAVGITFPASWCAAFVYWVLKKSGIVATAVVPKTGGVLKMWQMAKSYRVKTPEPGDVFIMDHGKGLGHTGLVIAVEGANIKTIEGNTNNDGSREGYQVATRVRPISKCAGFLRFWK
jgi:hypothetical protein